MAQQIITDGGGLSGKTDFLESADGGGNGSGSSSMESPSHVPVEEETLDSPKKDDRKLFCNDQKCKEAQRGVHAPTFAETLWTYKMLYKADELAAEEKLEKQRYLVELLKKL